MIFLFDTSDPLDAAGAEVGLEYGQLITPLTGRSNAGVRFAIDNGAFAGFNPDRFRAILKRDRLHRERCLFVAAPDVVGSARRTMECFNHWEQDLAGWPKALVLQDGVEDMSIPWDRVEAVFVGGTDRFKQSDAALDCARAAKIIGRWVHVGRVNTPDRMDRWIDVADSADGTGVARYSHMRRSLAAGLPLLKEAV